MYENMEAMNHIQNKLTCFYLVNLFENIFLQKRVKMVQEGPGGSRRVQEGPGGSRRVQEVLVGAGRV